MRNFCRAGFVALACLLFLALGLSAMPANASVITYRWKGAMHNTVPGWGEHQSPFLVELTVDSNAPDMLPQDPMRGAYMGAVRSAVLAVEGRTVFTANGGDVDLANDYVAAEGGSNSYDYLNFRIGPQHVTSGPVRFQNGVTVTPALMVYFGDFRYGTGALHSDELPTTENGMPFQWGSIVVEMDIPEPDGTIRHYGARSFVTGPAPLTVREPSAWVLCLAGLWAARRKWRS